MAIPVTAARCKACASWRHGHSGLNCHGHPGFDMDGVLNLQVPLEADNIRRLNFHDLLAGFHKLPVPTTDIPHNPVHRAPELMFPDHHHRFLLFPFRLDIALKRVGPVLLKPGDVEFVGNHIARRPAVFAFDLECRAQFVLGEFHALLGGGLNLEGRIFVRQRR